MPVRGEGGARCNRLPGTLPVWRARKTNLLCRFAEARALAVGFSVILQEAGCPGACSGCVVRQPGPALAPPAPHRSLLPRAHLPAAGPAASFWRPSSHAGRFARKPSDLRAEV